MSYEGVLSIHIESLIQLLVILVNLVIILVILVILVSANPQVIDLSLLPPAGGRPRGRLQHGRGRDVAGRRV